MRFLQPQYFNLFFFLLGLLPLWLYRLWTRHRIRKNLGDGPTLRRVSSPSSLVKECSTYLLVNLALIALIVALAHPQTIQEKGVPIPKRMDIVFLLDASPSMRATDIHPSRLEKAIEVIVEFARKKPSHDRIALVSFSSASLIISYLTEDVNNVLYYLDYLKEKTSPNMGTNIGNALKNSMTVIAKDREVAPAKADYKGVFILVSDGEDYGAELKGAIEEVRRSGIKVHTIGIGSREGAPIPMKTEDGKVTYLLDENGERILTRFDEQTLLSIAEQTGGMAYRSFSGRELESAFAEIVLKERTSEGFKKVIEYEDFYSPFLAGALGIFLTAMII